MNEHVVQGLPVAKSRGDEPKGRAEERRRPSGDRLQAAVVTRRPDDADPYADVPCTD